MAQLKVALCAATDSPKELTLDGETAVKNFGRELWYGAAMPANSGSLPVRFEKL